jgi:hypothetical protein
MWYSGLVIRISIAGEGRDNQSSPAIEKTD